MNKMTVRDIDTSGKKVLVRVDFNVPLDEKTGEITDDSRIRANLPTIKYLVARGAKVILLSHFGRPKGKVVDIMRLAIAARRLAHLLEQPVGTTVDCIGPEVERQVDGLKSGDVLLLENLRFHFGEEAGDTFFAQALACLGDIFVNDAFGTSHRAHASIVGIAKHLPAVAGLLLEKEVDTLGSILKDPIHPFVSMLGGAKISDKIALLANIMGKVDALLISGGMAAIFLKANSCEVGRSLVEDDMLGNVARLIEKAKKENVRLLLPVDVMVADELNDRAETGIVPVKSISGNQRIVDMGPQTLNSFSRELHGSRTVFWNGPVGVYEIPQFARGTQEMAKLVAGLKAVTIIGGGSTADAVNEMGLTGDMTFVSTGGGASLEFLSGEILPGVAALRDKSP
ncbi:MAG: phosphoglycerate kinase [Dehalococcoidales bacterium]|jgi:phosphoglycerate kinase|nr:phosphoglycerate kinase [Dehalococcoidales bacterium]